MTSQDEKQGRLALILWGDRRLGLGSLQVLFPEILGFPELLSKGNGWMHGRFGFGAGNHASFLGEAIALDRIAGLTGSNDVIPSVLSAFRAGNDVIQCEPFRAAAILAGVVIAA